jgi:hypothetical protein
MLRFVSFRRSSAPSTQQDRACCVNQFPAITFVFRFFWPHFPLPEPRHLPRQPQQRPLSLLLRQSPQLPPADGASDEAREALVRAAPERVVIAVPVPAARGALRPCCSCNNWSTPRAMHPSYGATRDCAELTGFFAITEPNVLLSEHKIVNIRGRIVYSQIHANHDARKLPPKAQENIRRLAVQAFEWENAGRDCRTLWRIRVAIWKWLKAYQQDGNKLSRPSPKGGLLAAVSSRVFKQPGLLGWSVANYPDNCACRSLSGLARLSGHSLKENSEYPWH